MERNSTYSLRKLMKGLDFLLIVGVVAYIVLESSKKEEGRVGDEEPYNGGDGPPIVADSYCSDPTAMNWNPLAPVNNTSAEKDYTCFLGRPTRDFQYNGQGDAPFLGDANADLGRGFRTSKFSMCIPESDLGNIDPAIIFRGYHHHGVQSIDHDDEMSACHFGEYFIGDFNKEGYFVNRPNMFTDGAASSSYYPRHQWTGYGGEWPERFRDMDYVSIQRPYDGLKIKSGLMINSLVYPSSLNKVDSTSYEVKVDVLYRPEIENAIRRWKEGVNDESKLKRFRKVGAPGAPQPQDLDLDGGASIPNAVNVGIDPNFIIQPDQPELQIIIRTLTRVVGYLPGSDHDFPYDWTPAPINALVSEAPEGEERIYQILDVNKDGVIDAEDAMFWIKIIGARTSEGENIVGDTPYFRWQGQAMGISYQAPLHTQAENAILNAQGEILGASGGGIRLGYNSEETAGRLLLQSSCYQPRMPIRGIDPEGNEILGQGLACEELYGGRKFLEELDAQERMEVLFHYDGLACGNDEGEELCFTIPEADMEGEYDDYLQIRDQISAVGAENNLIGEDEFGNELYQYDQYLAVNLTPQEGNSQRFRSKVKSEAQCPASHPNFLRFCMARQTDRRMVREGQILPVHDRT
jgi:hypothetical protein